MPAPFVNPAYKIPSRKHIPEMVRYQPLVAGVTHWLRLQIIDQLFDIVRLSVQYCVVLDIDEAALAPAATLAIRFRVLVAVAAAVGHTRIFSTDTSQRETVKNRHIDDFSILKGHGVASLV